MGDLGNLVLYMFDGILNRLKRLIYPFLSDNSLLTDTVSSRISRIYITLPWGGREMEVRKKTAVHLGEHVAANPAAVASCYGPVSLHK
jgi:hypothetical protein